MTSACHIKKLIILNNSKVISKYCFNTNSDILGNKVVINIKLIKTTSPSEEVVFMVNIILIQVCKLYQHP